MKHKWLHSKIRKVKSAESYKKLFSYPLLYQKIYFLIPFHSLCDFLQQLLGTFCPYFTVSTYMYVLVFSPECTHYLAFSFYPQVYSILNLVYQGIAHRMLYRLSKNLRLESLICGSFCFWRNTYMRNHHSVKLFS